MKKENVVMDKSFDFALRIIEVYKFLCEEKHEYVLSKQLLRSGTAIGALIREAEHAQSKADFINKISISLKEANETEYWLLLLLKSNYLTNNQANNLIDSNKELLRLLISILKTTKNK